MKLTLNIFGHEFGPWTPNTFGLHSGQMRSLRKMAHNGSWYNQDGVRVGWGDLSADDFLRIQAALETGESFFVLPESSFWRFVTNIGPTGATSTVNPIIDHPGMDYIKENFRYLITRDGFFYNKAASYLPGPMTVHGLEFLPWKGDGVRHGMDDIIVPLPNKTRVAFVPNPQRDDSTYPAHTGEVIYFTTDGFYRVAWDTPNPDSAFFNTERVFRPDQLREV